MTAPNTTSPAANVQPALFELESAVNSLQRQLVSLESDMSPFMSLFTGATVRGLQSELNALATNARQAAKDLQANRIQQKDYDNQLRASKDRVREIGVEMARYQAEMSRNVAILGGLSSIYTMLADGIKQAGALSITAQEAVGLQFRNQASALSSMFTLDPNKMVKPEEMYAAQQGVITALGGLRNGLQLSADGVQNIISDMRTGLRSQIIPTAETFRTLSFMGLRPTIEDMNKLREATGRAAIGAAQMDVLNRNRQALVIFGMQLSKTALDFDRVGISLNDVLAASQSYVTNLEGGLDAIAQLNQLGTNIDFGQLTMLMEYNPAEAQRYIAANVTNDQLQSSSFRALIQSLPGADIDKIQALRGMDTMESQLESAATKQKDASTTTDALTKGMAWLTQATTIVTGTFAGLTLNLIGLTAQVLKTNAALASMAATASASSTAPSTGAASPALPKLGAGAGAGTGMGVGVGAVSGITAAMTGGSWKKIVVASIAPILGGILGGVLATAIVAGLAMTGFGAPIAAAIGPGLISAVSLAGASLAGYAANKYMDDGISTPEAGRTLTTSAGTFALNPQDTVVAGTNLLPNKQPQQQPQLDITPLMKKIDSLVEAIASANTIIEIDGAPKTVNRMQLVGVYTRDETVRSI